MPFLIAPALVSAGLSAGAASIIGSLGSLVIGIGFQLISSILLKPAQPKPSDGQVVVKESTAPRFRSYGRVKVAGVTIHEGIYDGGSGGFLTRVFAMGSGEIDAVEEHWLDDGAVELGDVQDAGLGINVTTARWIQDGSSRVNITYNLGGDVPVDQNFNFLFNFLAPDWDIANQLGKGVVAAGVSLWQTAQEAFVTTFPRGGDTLYRQVQRASLIRGIEDGAFTAAAWSENAAAVIMDYLTHPDGLGISDQWIINEADLWAAQIALCAESVYDENGATEMRYRIGNTYYFDERPADVLTRFLQACDGILYPTANRGIALRVGVWDAPTVTIDDDAIIGFSDFGHGRDILTTANTIRARYTSPLDDYQEVDATPISDVDDIINRGEIASDIELFAVPSHSQTQRLMKLALARSMPEWAGKIVCNLRALPVLGERFINLIISELGVIGTFEVMGSRMIISEGSILSGIEIDVQSLDSTAYDSDYGPAPELTNTGEYDSYMGEGNALVSHVWTTSIDGSSSSTDPTPWLPQYTSGTPGGQTVGFVGANYYILTGRVYGGNDVQQFAVDVLDITLEAPAEMSQSYDVKLGLVDKETGDVYSESGWITIDAGDTALITTPVVDFTDILPNLPPYAPDVFINRDDGYLQLFVCLMFDSGNIVAEPNPPTISDGHFDLKRYGVFI